LAAGERLNAGHHLYGPLLPVDRLVPGYPGDFPAPLLSPPTIAVVWRLIALAGNRGLEAWWLLSVVFMAGLTAWAILRGRRFELAILATILCLGVPLTIFFGGSYRVLGQESPVAFSAWSGNLNSFIAVLFALTWWASARQRPWLAGASAALATALKVGPASIFVWFVARRDLRSIRAFIIAGALIMVATIAGSSVADLVQYLTKVVVGVVAPTHLSAAATVSRYLGVPLDLTRYVNYGVIAFGFGAIVLSRNRPRLSYLVAMLVTIYSSPAVLTGNFAILVALAMPWVVPAPRSGVPARPASPADALASERSVQPLSVR
ncbi:MAG: glycosyltransferase 87 family protein, partial [Candidatus Limnocylindrales bacterium]